MTKSHLRTGGMLSGLALLAVPATPSFAATATLKTNISNSFWALTHDPGTPGSSTTVANPLAIQGNSNPSATSQYNITKTFEPGGTSKGKAGVGRSDPSSSVAKLIFPSGIGVDQTDPIALPHQSASRVRIDFKATFELSGGGSFGPSITGTFSVPFGANVGNGAGAFALFECDVDWFYVSNGGAPTPARAGYTVNSATYTGPGSTGGLFTGAGSKLATFNAPASPFIPGSLTDGPGVDQLIVQGFVQFAVNNDETYSFGSFPLDPGDMDPNGPDLEGSFQTFTPQQGSVDEEKILQMIPQVGFEVVVPEPVTGGLLGLAALLLPRRRMA